MSVASSRAVASADGSPRRLRCRWALNGDGTYGDATGATPTHTHTTPGSYNASLRATDSRAITPQTKGRKNYNFESWSDGGAQTHDVIAPATATTYTARFRS